MDDVLTRVPLYARIPGGVAGHVARAPVQTADILETILEMAHVNSSRIRFATSLLPQLNGGEGALDRFVYSEGGFFYPNEIAQEVQECLSGGPEAMYYPRGLEESQPNGRFANCTGVMLGVPQPSCFTALSFGC